MLSQAPLGPRLEKTPETTSISRKGNFSGPFLKIRWAVIVLPLAYLWLRLVDNLRLEWTTNPQYTFGWIVPLLCLGLVARKWANFSRQMPEMPSQRLLIFVLFGLLAFLYLPTRLVEAATPEWRPIQWMLGIEGVGLTLVAILLGCGWDRFRSLVFPIAFIFVAVPWPTLIEAPIIQGLTHFSAMFVIEMLGWAGIPAIPHGNVIEVSTGIVGIDEACSGIRSFQSSLMISLFLGEFYDLGTSTRWLLVPMGIVLSMAFNIGRMFFLTFVAAKKGVTEIGRYHDPAGVLISFFCTLSLWGISAWWKKRESTKPVKGRARHETENAGDRINITPNGMKILSQLAISLIIWLLLVETGVQLWYRHLEKNLKPGPSWSVNFPEGEPDLAVIPIPESTRYLLRFDEGKEVAWTGSEGTHWQVFYCSWAPGRVAGYLAKRHTPEICLEATGYKLLSGPVLTMMQINGVDLPVRSYVFGSENGPLQVFHCRWEAGADNKAYVEHESARFNLIRGIWAGRGNKGQKVVEIIISGMHDPDQARHEVARELEKIITVGKT